MCLVLVLPSLKGVHAFAPKRSFNQSMPGETPYPYYHPYVPWLHCLAHTWSTQNVCGSEFLISPLQVAMTV